MVVAVGVAGIRPLGDAELEPEELEPPELDDPELLELVVGGDEDVELDEDEPPPQPATKFGCPPWWD